MSMNKIILTNLVCSLKMYYMEISIIKSKRRTISITVNTYGKVIVRVPLNASFDKINKFVIEKSDWINRVKQRIDCDNNSIRNVLSMREVMLFGEVKPFYNEYKNDLIKAANEYLPKRLNELANNYNFNYKAVQIRKFKAKWGSVDKNGVISLNFKLVILKKPLIDYVLLHELCHLKEFNHSKNFYVLLNKLDVNSEQNKNELKKFASISRMDL